MRTKKNTSLIPTKDEAREILNQVLLAQKGQDPINLPVAILQAWVGRVMLNAFERVKNEYDESIREFSTEMEKAIKRLNNSICKT